MRESYLKWESEMRKSYFPREWRISWDDPAKKLGKSIWGKGVACAEVPAEEKMRY